MLGRNCNCQHPLLIGYKRVSILIPRTRVYAFPLLIGYRRVSILIPRTRVYAFPLLIGYRRVSILIPRTRVYAFAQHIVEMHSEGRTSAVLTICCSGFAFRLISNPVIQRIQKTQFDSICFLDVDSTVIARGTPGFSGEIF